MRFFTLLVRCSLLTGVFFLSKPMLSQSSWSQLMTGADIPYGLAPEESLFDRANQRIYYRNTDDQKLGYLDLVSLTSVEIPSSGWFGRMDEMVLDTTSQTLYGWRAGKSTVYSIPVNGGTWTQASSSSSDGAHYGAASYWSPVSNGVGFVGGYGYYSMKNAVHEIPNLSGGWVEQSPNTSTGNPPRANFWLTGDQYGEHVYLYGREGNINGQQYQFPLDIQLGNNYNWPRGLWKLNLANHEFETILSLDDPDVLQFSDICYDWIENRLFVSGGTLLQSDDTNVNQGVTTNATQVLDLSNPSGFTEFPVDATYPPESGSLFFDGVNNRLIHYGSSGLWELPLNTLPGPGCTDPAACNYDAEATADDGNCTYPPTIYVDGTYFSDTVFTQLHETLVFESATQTEADSTLLDAFSVFFNAFSAHSLPVLEAGTDYRLIATGRYGFADGWTHNDAAFNYAWDVETGTKVNCNGTQDAQEDVRWLYDGATDFQRPDNDTDNNAQFCSGVDKTYFWTLPGDDNSHTVGFIDGGGYGDNSGELSFQLYELSSTSSITWPDGSSGPAWAYEANATGTFDLTLSDGSCSTNLVIVVDHAGCTDEGACNYDAAAATNDGSCEYTQEADYGLDPTLLACAPGVTLSAPAGLSGYTWSDGSTGSELSVSESGTYTLSTSEGESTGCGLEFEQGDYAALNQPISVDSDGYALRARFLFPLPETLCGSTPAHNLIMSSDNPVEWTPLGIRHNGQLAIHWNQNGFHWIESGYNTDALTGWHTVGVVLNGGTAEFYVDDEPVGSVAFTLPASATVQNLGNYIPTYWNSCQPIGQLDYVQLWLPDSNGQVDATPWDGVTPNHQWDLDCGNATAATQGTVDLTLQGSPEEITFNTACQSTDAVVVTINQNCVTTEFCGEGTIWDEDLGQCVPTVTDVPSAASCGAGTHWDPVTEMCIADVPGTTDENCTVMNLQELAEGYQVLLDHTADQDSIILALQDSLASCADGPAAANSQACAGEDHVTFDGYDYSVVGIGDQCWFAENLRTTTYLNGDAIPEVTDDAQWGSLSTGARCEHPAPEINTALSGLLYNWWVINDSRGACPSGWHVPSHDEWKQLEAAIGMSQAEIDGLAADRGTSAPKIKSAIHWDGTDEFGFNAVPAGRRSGNADGAFLTTDNTSFFWTSTPSTGAWYRALRDNEPAIIAWNNGDGGDQGMSIRCVKD